MSKPVNTPLGCVIRVGKAPWYLGDGVLVTGRMRDPRQARRSFQVYLDHKALGSFIKELTHEYEQLKEHERLVELIEGE